MDIFMDTNATIVTNAIITFLFSLVLAGLGWIMKEQLLDKTNDLNKTLEDYKKEVSKELSDYNSELSQALEEHKTRYSLYTERKQQYIFELYEKMYWAYEVVIYLNFPLREYPDYKDYSEEDIKKVLTELPLIESLRAKTLDLWKKDKRLGFEKIIEYQSAEEEIKAKKATQEFSKSVLRARLIFDDIDFKKLDNFGLHLREFIFYNGRENKNLIKMEDDPKLREKNRKDIKEKKKIIEKEYAEIIEYLKGELFK